MSTIYLWNHKDYDGEIHPVYIGLTTQPLEWRLYQHNTRRGDLRKYELVGEIYKWEVSPADLDIIETYLINYFAERFDICNQKKMDGLTSLFNLDVDNIPWELTENRMIDGRFPYPDSLRQYKKMRYEQQKASKPRRGVVRTDDEEN